MGRVFSSEALRREDEPGRLGGAGRKRTQRFSDVDVASAAEQGDGEIAARGQDLGCRPRPNLAAGLSEAHVTDPVCPMLDPPVPTERRQHLPRVGLAGGERRAGRADCPFLLDHASPPNRAALPLQPGHLVHRRPRPATGPAAAHVGAPQGVGAKPPHPHRPSPVPHLRLPKRDRAPRPVAPTPIRLPPEGDCRRAAPVRPGRGPGGKTPLPGRRTSWGDAP
jgi:hypothetical protein